MVAQITNLDELLVCVSSFTIFSCHIESFFCVCVFFSIYAIGDCVDGPMLAHKAEDEGI